jgi:hypothetical protein
MQMPYRRMEAIDVLIENKVKAFKCIAWRYICVARNESLIFEDWSVVVANSDITPTESGSIIFC